MARESKLLLSLVLALVLIGVFMVFSASAANDHASARMSRQLVYVLIGFVGLILAAHFDYHHLRSPVLLHVIVFTSLLFLILVLIPGVGDVRMGARRWLQLGGFSFQPSEVAKFALIVLLAAKLSENQEHRARFVKGFLPPIIITGTFTV